MMQRLCFIMLMSTTGVVVAQRETPRTGALIGEEKRVRDELEAAGKLAADKQFDDAVRRYQQILTESGDLLVSLEPAEPRRSLPARWIVHRKIAALPPEARKLYRAAVEEMTRTWLEQGTANRDVRLLEQIVSEAFCSAATEQALHLLGDLAFERGEFEAAEHYWKMLTRYPSEKGDGDATALHHPDSSGDGALAKSKLILARLFRGDRAAAAAELDHFRQQHPNAAGSLAGRNGKFVEIVQSLFDADVGANSTRGLKTESWPTLGGDASRNLVFPSSAVPYWPDIPIWQKKLEGDPKAKPHRDSDPPLGSGPSARSLALHPVIVPGFALVADAARVFAYDLTTGELAAQYDHRANAGLPDAIDLRVPSRTDAAYTLSVHGDRVYARFGATAMKPPDGAAKPRDGESMIVCLALRRETPVKFELLWQIRARPLDTDAPSIFEGAPAVRDGRLYVGRTRFDGRQVIAGIECYEADGGAAPDEPPARCWRQELWTVDIGVETPRHRHELLTLAGGNVVCCTNSGAIVAVDATSGRRAWAYRYPVASNRVIDGVHPRDLCPCIAAAGRVYAAPADSNRILCLDAQTGERIWESEAVNTIHLLGVARGLLIATLGGFPHGIRAYDAASGRVAWTKPDDGDVATFGRGLLSDRWIYWPTRHGLRVLRLDDGEAIDAGSSTQPLGHLAFADGHLIAATPTEICGFVPTRKLAPLMRQARHLAWNDNFCSLLPSFDAESNYLGALARIETGDEIGATNQLLLTESLAGANTFLNGQPLRDLARHRRFELLMGQAERFWTIGNREAALRCLRQASSESFALVDRVRAWALRYFAGDPARPTGLPGAELRDLWVSGPSGLPQRADEFLSNLREINRTSRWRPPRDRTAPPSVPIEISPDPPVPWKSRTLFEFKAHSEWPLTPFRHADTGEEGSSLLAEGRFFSARRGEVICRAAETGKPIWTREIGHDAEEFGLDGEAIVVAGREGISRLRRSNGEILWQFRLPDPAPMPAAFPDPTLRRLEWRPCVDELSAFRIAGAMVCCRAGRNRMWAFDLETGRVIWQFQLPDASSRPRDHGSIISPHILATPSQVLLQSSAGELLALRAADGKLMFRLPAPTPWTWPPIRLDEQTAVYVDGPKLRSIDLTTGVERWSYVPKFHSSLAGSTTQVRRERSNLVVVVERNFGWELERLHLDGRPELGPISLGKSPIDLNRSALNGTVYALHAGDRLLALDLERGRKLWTKPLPAAGSWRIRATLSAIIVHPDFAISYRNANLGAGSIDRLFDSVPTLDRIQSVLGMTWLAYLDREFTLRALSPSNGVTLHEQRFLTQGPRVHFMVGGHNALVGLNNRFESLHQRD